MCFVRVLQGSIFRNTVFSCIVVLEIIVFILSFVFSVICVHSLHLLGFFLRELDLTIGDHRRLKDLKKNETDVRATACP